MHRSFHAFIASLPNGPLRSIAKTLGAFVQKAVEIVTGICVPNKTEVGGGLYFPRFGAIILSHGSIGENCTIEQNVTLGIAGRGDERGHPTIGNRVFIGAGAMIVGKITIGDDAYIFPGSVVTRPVPPRAVVMGYPARSSRTMAASTGSRTTGWSRTPSGASRWTMRPTGWKSQKYSLLSPGRVPRQSGSHPGPASGRSALDVCTTRFGQSPIPARMPAK